MAVGQNGFFFPFTNRFSKVPGIFDPQPYDVIFFFTWFCLRCFLGEPYYEAKLRDYRCIFRDLLSKSPGKRMFFCLC